MYIVYVYIQKCIYKGKRCACEYGYITYNVKEKQEKTCTFVSLHQYSLYLVAEFSITYVYFGLHTRTPECSIRPSECFGSVAKKKKNYPLFFTSNRSHCIFYFLSLCISQSITVPVTFVLNFFSSYIG